MSVLVEAYSVIVKKQSIAQRFPGGMSRFSSTVPNGTYCADENLVRVGFMDSQDVEDYLGHLIACGLVFRQNGHPEDINIVDPIQGLHVECDWLRLTKINLNEGEIFVAYLVGDESGPGL